MAGFGLANTVQSNSVAQVLTDNLDIPWQVTGGWVLMILVGGVILGGIQRIAATAGAVGANDGGSIHVDECDRDCTQYSASTSRPS